MPFDMAQTQIDSLLERYLALLDEYTQLREQLSRCQSDVFHSLARANFSAERSMRYGRDHYDERMQASRRLNIVEEGDGEGLKFEVVNVSKVEAKEEADKEDDEDERDEKEADIEGEEKEESAEGEPKVAKEKKPVDPLFWFGLFPPSHLRNVQAHSIEAAEAIIPRLVTVNTEMQNIEIEVRRARKKRAKATEKQTKADTLHAAPAVEAS